MNVDLKKLQIDRDRKQPDMPPWRAGRWVVLLAIPLLAACAYALYASLAPVPAARAIPDRRLHGDRSEDTTDRTVLNATGYVAAAHRIEVASSVVGRVAWIGVEKGDRVREGQVLVRLEDNEYRARLLEAEGHLDSLRARLAALEQGSRPEEIARAAADAEQARAEVKNVKAVLERTRVLAESGLVSRQNLDDVQARHDIQAARLASLEHAYELVRNGPRLEDIEAMRGSVKQSEATLAFAKSQLENTAIRAPVSGTVLARNVEKGEFVTTGFAGDRGAKGWVISLADLSELDVQLDIGQGDFAKLTAQLDAIITTDAYPDHKYSGRIHEISPEASRDKATVQVKVRILEPDAFLRPDMNATVVFIASPGR